MAKKYNLNPDYDTEDAFRDDRFGGYNYNHDNIYLGGRTLEEEGVRILNPEEEEDGWCENEEMGLQCTYPECQCQCPPYFDEEEEGLMQELPEMFGSARIVDGFYDDE